MKRESADPAEERSFHKRAGRLIGETSRARAVTAVTVVALAAALVAFLALDPDEDTIPRDAYTISADRICIDAKRKIVAAERLSLHNPRGGTTTFAGTLVPIVSAWRSELQALATPSDRVEETLDLDAALRDVEIQVASLSLVARGGDRTKTLAKAKQVDSATARVEEAISALGLERCAQETIGFSPTPAQ